LTHRERFIKLFTGERVDRAPFIEFMGGCNFNSCLPRWKTEGLAADADWADVRRIIGFDYIQGNPRSNYIDAKIFFFPEFEVEFVKREGDKTYVRNRWGGLELQKDGSELMPLTIEGPVEDRVTWEAVKWRLSGLTAERMPPEIERIRDEFAESGIPVYAGDLPAGFFGALREMVGFENLMYLFYDEPELVSEMLDTLCDLWITMYSELQKHVPIDFVLIWEDMCGKTGSLIGLDMFREFLLPRYKRLISAIRANGCPLFMVDSDGDERPLVPLWEESGVNIVVPWESQFGMDVAEVRRQHPTLGIIGGLDKHSLEFSKKEMDAELAKVPYMLEKGRYIPSVDHGLTSDVPWDNYLYFYNSLRELIYKYAY